MCVCGCVICIFAPQTHEYAFIIDYSADICTFECNTRHDSMHARVHINYRTLLLEIDSGLLSMAANNIACCFHCVKWSVVASTQWKPLKNVNE